MGRSRFLELDFLDIKDWKSVDARGRCDVEYVLPGAETRDKFARLLAVLLEGAA